MEDSAAEGGTPWAEALVEELLRQGSATQADVSLARLTTCSDDPAAWLVYWQQIRLVSADEVQALRAELKGWPFLTMAEFDPACGRAVGLEWAVRYGVLPWCRVGGKWRVAMAEPRLAELKQLACLLAEPVEPALVTAEVLQLAQELIADASPPLPRGQAVALERILEDALAARASDVHLQPIEGRLALRWRVDGVLRPGPDPATDGAELFNHLKLRAGLSSTEQRRPQDGRFSAAGCNWRVSILPGLAGESAVLRLLDHAEAPETLSGLEIPVHVRERVVREIQRPEGLVLVTGPTGSGKTTTLYAMARAVSGPGRKVATVEDPIEVRLPGVAQVAVRAEQGLGFAQVLRSLLRQAPDVVLLGEIRDAETARVAVEASLTGHLVLSSLHTNDSVGAITRLRDLGIEDYRLAACLRGVLAQRLVPRRDMGRVAVFEWLPISPALSAAVHAGANEAELRQRAIEAGMADLATHAAALVEAGTVSAEAAWALTK